MAKCKNCRNFDMAITSDNEYICNWCEKIKDNPHEEIERECEYYEAMTNADRIRSMTDEELAEWIEGFYACIVLGANIHFDAEIEGSTLEWLKSEVGCE